MWQKGLLSLVTEKVVFKSQRGNLTFPCGQFLEDVPVGSYRVGSLMHEGEESVLVI